MQQIPFIDLFKAALHISGDKLAHPQDLVTGRQQHRCIVPKAVYTVKKVLLRMGEFVARNM